MRPIITLLRKDFVLFFRDKAALTLTFLVPVALIFLFGQIFGVNRKDSGPTGIPLAVVVDTDSPVAGQLVTALKAETAFRVITDVAAPDGTLRRLTEADARAAMKANAYRFVLILPPDLISEERLGVRLKFLSNPRNEIETQTVNGLLQKTIFSNVPQLLGQSLQARARHTLGADRLDRFNGAIADTVAGAFGGSRDDIYAGIQQGSFGLDQLGSGPTSTGGGTDAFSQLVKLETEQVAGKNVSNPAATRIVGGWAVQFLLFALSASAVALFREKDQGLFQRLLAAPLLPSHILWSKFLYGVALGLIQLLTLFCAGRVLFGIDVISHFFPLVLVCVCAAAACTSFGMLIAALSPSPDVARSLSTFLILTMSAIGGAWFPPSFMPEFIQQLSKLTLVYWSIEGFVQVLWAGDSIREVLPTLGILLGITAVVSSITVWRFRSGTIFE